MLDEQSLAHRFPSDIPAQTAFFDTEKGKAAEESLLSLIHLLPGPAGLLSLARHSLVDIPTFMKGFSLKAPGNGSAPGCSLPGSLGSCWVVPAGQEQAGNTGNIPPAGGEVLSRFFHGKEL